MLNVDSTNRSISTRLFHPFYRYCRAGANECESSSGALIIGLNGPSMIKTGLKFISQNLLRNTMILSRREIIFAMGNHVTYQRETNQEVLGYKLPFWFLLIPGFYLISRPRSQDFRAHSKTPNIDVTFMRKIRP